MDSESFRMTNDQSDEYVVHYFSTCKIIFKKQIHFQQHLPNKQQIPTLHAQHSLCRLPFWIWVQWLIYAPACQMTTSPEIHKPFRG